MDMSLEHSLSGEFQEPRKEGRARMEQVKGKQEVLAGKVEPENAEL